MFQIPAWMLNIIMQFTCPKCNKKMAVDGVSAIGIRKSYKNEKKESLYVEYKCKSCSEKTNIEMQNMSLEDFALTVLEEMDDCSDIEDMRELDRYEGQSEFGEGMESLMDEIEEQAEKQVYDKKQVTGSHDPLHVVRSKITQKELDEFKKKLSDINMRDLFKDVGIPPDIFHSLESYGTHNDK